MANAIVYAGVKLGDDTIVNTKANISCESIIEDHVHIAPGAIVSGGSPCWRRQSYWYRGNYHSKYSNLS